MDVPSRASKMLYGPTGATGRSVSAKSMHNAYRTGPIGTTGSTGLTDPSGGIYPSGPNIPTNFGDYVTLQTRRRLEAERNRTMKLSNND